MRRIKKILKVLGWIFGIIILLLICFIIYVKMVSTIDAPSIKDMSSLKGPRELRDNGILTIKNNWFKHSKSGLYELYVEGDPFERGVINGKLTRELVVRQEEHFGEQIFKMIPSKFNRNYLKDMIGFFNRNLDKNISEEYKDEIYGISFSASRDFQYLGSNYQRLLNYHAAHDIGHAVQNLALVGCTSFGTWGGASEDSTMIIGRNFDFWVGDKFSEEKIVAFFNPTKGHKFMTVTWGGFVGAVSGMNEEGLSVTINAAKSSIPYASATPVSLVAREILQYAKNIGEALAIAKSRKMFVSESFLVASANDNKAVIIEKTPDDIDVYDPHKDMIICTNHFQSNEFINSAKNKEQVQQSASAYRYERMMELLKANGKNNVQKTIAILRDRRGVHNRDIGDGNEKAVNQLIAHHSIVFEPKEKLVWVSTAPWQLGQYVCYDLTKIFSLAGLKKNIEIIDSARTIAADPFLYSDEYNKFIKFRTYKQTIMDGGTVNPDSVVASDPQFYNAYVLAGDYCYKQKNYTRALEFYKMALTKEIATKNEEAHIRKQIKKIENR